MSVPLSHIQRGLTLVEVLVASAIAVLIIIVLGTLSSSHTSMNKELRTHGEALIAQTQPTLAVTHIAEDLASADRVALNTASNFYQFRIPALTTAGCAGVTPLPACYNDARNFEWHQYWLDGADLKLAIRHAFDATSGSGTCDPWAVLATQISTQVGGSGLSFEFVDQAGPPPGGDPVSVTTDNNVVLYKVTWNDGTRDRQLSGKVTCRNIPYSNVSETATDSGSGLAPPGTSSPPAKCP